MGQTIKLDTRKREDKYGEARIAPLRRGARNNVLLTVKVCANGAPYDLVGKTASLVATTAAGKLVGPCPMECVEAGIARIMLPVALYSAVGAFSGYVEIREGETLVDTTDSFGGKVIECADLDSEQAAEFTPVLRDMEQAVADAKRATTEASEAASHQPRIGESDTWEVWDVASAEYVDTGVAARGAQGIQGEPGKDGAPGSDAPATDVRIAGKSITADGVADIPIGGNVAGVVKSGTGTVVGSDGAMYTIPATNAEISNREANDGYGTSDNERCVISPSRLDYAVKAAMCDGKGAAWTDAEKSAARERMGISDSGGSSPNIPSIWVYDTDHSPNEDGYFTFLTANLTCVYPYAYDATFPKDGDIVFHEGYIYHDIADSDSSSAIYMERERIY